MADHQPHEASSATPNGSAVVASPQSSMESRSPSLRNQPAARVSRISPPNHHHHHRHSHSLSETLRGVTPGSPRSRRQPSLTQAAIQSLIDNPPVRNPADPAFAGRDWRQISIGELVSPDDLRFVELDTGIEEATNVRKMDVSRECVSFFFFF